MEKVQTVKRTTSRTQPTPGEEAFTKIVASSDEVATLRRLLKEITLGPAFKGSLRSGQFLEFVVEQSIAGNFDHLKERLIGVALFKREPSYDTGEDAIVRVTASDVRKRLLQHYGWFGSEGEFRIELPLGSYIPRVSRNHVAEDELRSQLDPLPATQPPDAATVEQSTRTPVPALSVVAAPGKGGSSWRFWRSAAILVLAVVFGWLLRSQVRGTHSPPTQPATGTSTALPWSALFGGAATPHLITSDANIDTVQGITHTNLSLSDYANHRYIPQPNTLTPEQLRFCKVLLGSDSSAATPDLPITARVAQIAQTFSKRLLVQSSRNFQLSFLNNGDNFIFLGSPRSNPWFSAFAGALHFQFVYQPALGSEFIRNLHPHKGEPATYVPSANGGGTGYSFAVVALVQNPDQEGEVLLLAGADGEATAAAGEFVTDLPRMSRALAKCGLPSTGSAHHFEMLLQTDTMAGVSRRTDIIACHLLASNPAASSPAH